MTQICENCWQPGTEGTVTLVTMVTDLAGIWGTTVGGASMWGRAVGFSKCQSKRFAFLGNGVLSSGLRNKMKNSAPKLPSRELPIRMTYKICSTIVLNCESSTPSTLASLHKWPSPWKNVFSFTLIFTLGSNLSAKLSSEWIRLLRIWKR